VLQSKYAYLFITFNHPLPTDPLYLSDYAIYSNTYSQYQWEGEKARERTGHPLSYMARLKKRSH